MCASDMAGMSAFQIAAKGVPSPPQSALPTLAFFLIIQNADSKEISLQSINLNSDASTA